MQGGLDTQRFPCPIYWQRTESLYLSADVIQSKLITFSQQGVKELLCLLN